MKIADQIRATTTINVRLNPDLQAPIMARLQAGEQRLLRGGPVYADKLTWWAITGGWVAELAPDGTRLLEPVLALTNWQRSIAFVLREEGGYSQVKSDAGNWTGGKVGVGVLRGTKYGISAASYPSLDIYLMTVEQATAIYLRDFWPIASDYPWPLCLAVLDLAVNGGKGRAAQGLAAVGADFHALMGWRIVWYTNLQDFSINGKG